MGNGTAISMMQISPDLYNLLFNWVIPPRENLEWPSDRAPIMSVLQRVEEHDTRIKKLIQLATSSRLFNQTFHDSCSPVSKYDEFVLIGDAVHSIYINGTHHTSAMFEEAFTFGRLFALSEPSQSKEYASLLLNGYQQIQQERTRKLEKSSMDTIVFLSLTPGPERDRRNNGFRLTLNLEGVDNTTLEQIWAGNIAHFNYDARDAVDEWWMNWSKLERRHSISCILNTHESSCDFESRVKLMA